MTHKAQKKNGVNSAHVARGDGCEELAAGSQDMETLKVNGHNGHALPHVNGSPVNGHMAELLSKANGTAHVNSQATKKSGQQIPVGSHGVNGAPGHRSIERDRKLVERCIGGEPTAWSQMYDRFHGPLLASIRGFLGRIGQNFHLVDEISARVWYALVRNQFELLGRFDPSRGCRLSTFLSVLAKAEARLLLRSERRRKSREQVASRSEIEEPPAGGGDVLSDEEFISSLSPAERAFYLDILITTCGSNGIQYTQQNQWQLRHRVRKKLERFLE